MHPSLKANVVLLHLLLICAMATVGRATPVVVQDFETEASPPTVWVVNIPNENASVRLSPDQPHDGKQCRRLSSRQDADSTLRQPPIQL
jgi:hypothetical protein